MVLYDLFNCDGKFLMAAPMPVLLGYLNLFKEGERRILRETADGCICHIFSRNRNDYFVTLSKYQVPEFHYKLNVKSGGL